MTLLKMTLNIHNVVGKVAHNFAKSEIYFIFTFYTIKNNTKFLQLYNKRVIALISVNIAPLWDIYERSQAHIPRYPNLRQYSPTSILIDISVITQYYFILSSEINAYQKQIKVISITSEMI